MQEAYTKQTYIDAKNFSGKLQLSRNIVKLQLIVPSKQLNLSCEITNKLIEQNKGLYMFISNVNDLYSELISQRQLEVDDRNRLVISTEGTYGDKKINHSVVIEFKVMQFQNHIHEIEFMYKHLQEKLAFTNRRQNHHLASVKKILFVGDTKNKYYPQYQIRENLYSLRLQAKAQLLLNHKDEMHKNGVYEISFKLLQQESSNVSIGLCAMNIFQSPNPLVLKKLWVGLDLSNCQVTHNEQKIRIGDIQFKKGSKCTMTINMDLQQIAWAVDGYQFVMIRFTDHLCHQRFYPFISMKKKSKPIQFLQE